MQRLHLGSVISAMITSCFHCHGQIIGTSKSRNKQRYKKGNHVFCLLDQISIFEICTSGNLRFHDLISLLQKDRDKTKGNGHHHGDLMNRHADLVQRAEQSLQTICQLVRCGRQRHNRRSDHKINKTDRHSSCKNKPFFCYLDDSETPQHFARRQNNIEHNRDQKDHNDSFQTLEHEFHRNLGNRDHGNQKYGRNCISQKSMEQEHRDQKSQSSQKFRPGIQSVKNGFGRIILANGNVSDHFSAPPLFSNGEFTCLSATRILSLASSTVVASASTERPCAFSACII